MRIPQLCYLSEEGRVLALYRIIRNMGMTWLTSQLKHKGIEGRTKIGRIFALKYDWHFYNNPYRDNRAKLREERLEATRQILKQSSFESWVMPFCENSCISEIRKVLSPVFQGYREIDIIVEVINYNEG